MIALLVLGVLLYVGSIVAAGRTDIALWKLQLSMTLGAVIAVGTIISMIGGS